MTRTRDTTWQGREGGERGRERERGARIKRWLALRLGLLLVKATTI